MCLKLAPQRKFRQTYFSSPGDMSHAISGGCACVPIIFCRLLHRDTADGDIRKTTLKISCSRVIIAEQQKIYLVEIYMGTGIIVCGLNGAGKSTLGKALAKELNFHFIDIEDLYFPGTDPYYIYSSPRTRDEAEMLLCGEIKSHENFVFASVHGNYGKTIHSFFQYAVLIEVPKDIRLQRIKNRSFQKFGSRMLPGGDLCERENDFFAFVGSRKDTEVEEWTRSLRCPVIRIDGTVPVEENISLIITQIGKNRI